MPPVEGGTVNFKIFSPLIEKGIPFVLEPTRGTDEKSIQRAVEYLTSLWGIEETTGKEDTTI